MRNAEKLLKLSKLTADTQVNFTERGNNVFNITIYHDRSVFKETIRGTIVLDSGNNVKSLDIYARNAFYKDVALDIKIINEYLDSKGMELISLLNVDSIDILKALHDSGKLGGNVVDEEPSEPTNHEPTANDVSNAIDFAVNNKYILVESINSFGVITVVDNEAFTLKELNSIYKMVINSKV